MTNGFTIPRPKMALAQAARLPNQVLPTGLGRPLSNALASMTNALPDIALPSAQLPKLPAITGVSGPPTPKMFLTRAETVLPAGAPRMSTIIPDITLPSMSLPSTASGFRPISKTSASTNGTVRTGGYRSI